MKDCTKDLMKNSESDKESNLVFVCLFKKDLMLLFSGEKEKRG